MKFSKLKAVALVLVVFLLSGLSYGQECANGQCYRQSGVARQVVGNTVRGTAQAVGQAGTTAIHATGVAVGRVVHTTGHVLGATLDAAGTAACNAARIATFPATGLAHSARGLAQSKAERQAAMQRCCHVGGGFGGARYEGVGFSTVSEEDAIKQCCYSNRPIRESGVAYGYNQRLRCYGWFATILCD